MRISDNYRKKAEELVRSSWHDDQMFPEVDFSQEIDLMKEAEGSSIGFVEHMLCMNGYERCHSSGAVSTVWIHPRRKMVIKTDGRMSWQDPEPFHRVPTMDLAINIRLRDTPTHEKVNFLIQPVCEIPPVSLLKYLTEEFIEYYNMNGSKELMYDAHVTDLDIHSGNVGIFGGWACLFDW